MTTHQLAMILIAGPDLMVTRRGYEGETVFPPASLYLNVNNEDYYGPHEYHENFIGAGEAPPVPPDCLAIHLG